MQKTYSVFLQVKTQEIFRLTKNQILWLWEMQLYLFPICKTNIISRQLSSSVPTLGRISLCPLLNANCKCGHFTAALLYHYCGFIHSICPTVKPFTSCTAISQQVELFHMRCAIDRLTKHDPLWGLDCCLLMWVQSLGSLARQVATMTAYVLHSALGYCRVFHTFVYSCGLE